MKYADLSTARESAYLFDWDRMISFRGNTGPYLTVRDRADPVRSSAGSGTPTTTPAGRRRDHRGPGAGAGAASAQFEQATVTQLGETRNRPPVQTVPFEVASWFTTFYEECPVLKAEPESLRVGSSRSGALTLHVLDDGVYLLGVPVPSGCNTELNSSRSPGHPAGPPASM